MLQLCHALACAGTHATYLVGRHPSACFILYKGSSARLAAVVVYLWDKSGAQVTSHTERCVVDRCCGVDSDSGSAVFQRYHCCRQFLFAPR